MTGSITNVQMTIIFNLCDTVVSDLILERGCLPIAPIAGRPSVDVRSFAASTGSGACVVTGSLDADPFAAADGPWAINEEVMHMESKQEEREEKKVKVSKGCRTIQWYRVAEKNVAT